MLKKMTKFKWRYVPPFMGFVWVILIVCYIVFGKSNFERMVADFTGRKINGVLVRSEIASRGFYYIDIRDKISDSVLRYTVPQSWFFRENNISIKDSVSKIANSKLMTFYKIKNGTFEKCCEYEIGM